MGLPDRDPASQPDPTDTRRAVVPGELIEIDSETDLAGPSIGAGVRKPVRRTVVDRRLGGYQVVENPMFTVSKDYPPTSSRHGYRRSN
jgi:hypothetical protein